MQHGVAQVAQKFDLLGLVFPFCDAVNHLDAAGRANAARCAFTAGLNGAELHRVACQLGHVGGVVMHHDAAVTDSGADRDIGFVVEGNIPMRFRHVGAQRATHLHRFDRSAAGAAATVVEYEFAQRDTKRLFDQATMQDVARQLDRQRAAGASHAIVLVVLGTARQNDGHRGQRNHVVDDARLTEQALQGGDRRLGTNHAALAFNALQHRCFFTAHIRACRLAHFQMKTEA